MEVRETERATLFLGDALAVLATLDSGCVDAVVTDPPYSSGGMFRADRAQSTVSKYVTTQNTHRDELVDFSGDSRDQRSYQYWCALWLAECLRVTKSGGVCLMFTDWRQLPATTDALQSGGWIWRGIVPWHKPAGRPTQGRYANSCEYIVWGSNGARDLLALDGKALPGFYQANSPREREHITQKPLSVMRELVKITPPGGVVLDPFMGSGTTGAAAIIEGRSFIGAEQDQHYYEVANRRIMIAAQEATDLEEQGALL